MGFDSCPSCTCGSAVTTIASPYTVSPKVIYSTSTVETPGADYAGTQGGQVGAALSNAWTVNAAMLVPVIMQNDLTVIDLWWINGGAVAGNTDVGIYDASLAAIVRLGPIANVGVNTLQQSPAAANLTAGVLYWLAISNDDAGQQYVSVFINGYAALDQSGYKQQVGAWAGGLPATITPAHPSTSANFPHFGLTGVTML